MERKIPSSFVLKERTRRVVVNIGYLTQFCVFVPKLSLAMKVEYRL